MTFTTNGVDASDATRTQLAGAMDVDGPQTATRTVSTMTEINYQPNPPQTIVSEGSTAASLRGTLSFITPIIATHRESYQKAIVKMSKTMLDAAREIRARAATLARFSSTFSEDMGMPDQQTTRERAFIPHSLRGTLTLNSSSIIQNDSRLRDERTAIERAATEARRIHEQYQKDVADCMKTVAESELKARKKLLLSEYLQSLHDIALISVIMTKPSMPAGSRSDEEIALEVGTFLLGNLPEDHWRGCPFLDEDHADCPAKMTGAFRKSHATRRTAGLRFDASDNNLIETCSDFILPTWIHITTGLWKHDRDVDSQRQIDASISQLTAKMGACTATAQVAEVIDRGSPTTLLPLIRREVELAVATQKQQSKKSIRKNSSGGRKNHRSTPTGSGTIDVENLKSARGNKSKQESAGSRKPSATSQLNRQGRGDASTTTSTSSVKRPRSTSQGDSRQTGNTVRRSNKTASNGKIPRQQSPHRGERSIAGRYPSERKRQDTIAIARGN